MVLDILLTIFLVVLNGFFVAAEFAIVKVRASQIELRARSGNIFARMARSLIIHLDEYLSATQLGITLASLGLGWIGEEVVAKLVISAAQSLGYPMETDVAHKIATVIAFSIITVLHIVFGELAPKSMAIQRSEQVALAVSFPLRAFYFVFKPFIWLLNSFANIILKSIGIEPAHEQELHSPEEIRYLIEESQKSGAIHEDEHELIENVFEFKETHVSEVMIPRRSIVGIEVNMPSEQILEKVMDEGYSRMPVYSGTIDNIVGVVYTKDLLSLMRYSTLILIQDILRKPVFVQEDDKISSVLRRMKKEQFHLAVVVDEFGSTAGLITLEDVIEEIVGEIHDEYDDAAAPVEQRTSATDVQEYIVNATTTIADLNEHLPVALPESDEYDTLGGLLNSVAGRIPSQGDVFEIHGYHATVIEASKRVIETVKLVPHVMDTGTSGDEE
ncbi:MAG: HlyC/CorC family transporter [Candidatus Kapabacteria bacterium]|nr:HlyC/CorC family transporter [Candidatus Kapabacteria bacterium]